MKTWHGLGAALLVSVVAGGDLLAVSATPASAAGPYTSNILGAVNSARANEGLRPYALRSDLSSVAYRWTQRMAARNALGHNPRLGSEVSNWRYVGENVGYGPDWKSVMTAFMSSSAHRANILDRDFTEIGIGVVVDGDRVWVTQVFRDPLRSATRASRPRATGARRPAGTAPPALAREQLLARRIEAAARRRPAQPRDPVDAAVGFASAMRAIAGRP